MNFIILTKVGKMKVLTHNGLISEAASLLLPAVFSFRIESVLRLCLGGWNVYISPDSRNEL
jgi:hypothetical protein